jgi:hypothetical protein
MAEWTIPIYRREEVNSAGWVLLALSGGEEINPYPEWAFDVVNNWRSAHNYPLNTVQMLLRDRARAIDKKALVAQRSKRLSSCINKLAREENMKMTQIQDIGGCRAVMPNIRTLHQLMNVFKERELDHECKLTKNYIEKPSSTGYRCAHYVLKYHNADRPEYNTLKIELQLRTQLQHIWATAVETIDTFERRKLKWGIDEEDGWLRFFALVGSVIALEEGTPPVPGTPSDPDELAIELGYLRHKLKAVEKLRGYARSVEVVPQTIRGAHWFLLSLDVDRQRIHIRGFKRSQMKSAEDMYRQQGRDLLGDTGQNVVLVSVDDMAALRRAYPNYRGDSEAFCRIVEQKLSSVKQKAERDEKERLKGS